jgi:hypothetical protein
MIGWCAVTNEHSSFKNSVPLQNPQLKMFNFLENDYHGFD